MSSSPTEPWPAMTAGSSNGWTNVEAFGVADALQLGERLADVRPVEDDRARRSPRHASTFERTAPAGMTTVTATPAARPAQA